VGSCRSQSPASQVGSEDGSLVSEVAGETVGANATVRARKIEQEIRSSVVTVVIGEDELKFVIVGEGIDNAPYVRVKRHDVVFFVVDGNDERNQRLSKLHGTSYPGVGSTR
jgi:hypothetical protein